MIKLLTISGSPVEGASTDILLAKSAESFLSAYDTSEEITVQHFKLSSLTFIPCQACGKSPEPHFCFYDDDLSSVYKELAECDVLLFGSPIYFDSVSAQAKSFIDRCNCFRPPDFTNSNPDYDFLKRIKQKRPGGIILVGGERGWFEGARRVIAGFFKWIEVTNESMVVYKSPDFRQSGSVASDEKAIGEALAMGKLLATKVKSVRK